MNTPGYVDTWPHPFRALDDIGQPTGDAVEVHQLRPDLLDAFLTWSGGTPLLVNGGPAVLLPGTRPAAERVVGLGDFAVHTTSWWAEPAAGFYNRFRPE